MVSEPPRIFAATKVCPDTRSSIRPVIQPFTVSMSFPESGGSLTASAKCSFFPAGGGCALLVHGGAWAIPDEEVPDYRRGLRDAVATGSAALQEGAAAIDVVAAVVATMESSGFFDAGRGAVLTRDGTVELDAGIMRGSDLAWGAVGAVQRIAEPINIARLLAVEGDGSVRLLVADGAERFAAAHGIELVENEVLVCERETRRLNDLQQRARYHTSHTFLPADGPRGTVGCVARDSSGALAAATSTGGTPNRPSGRIGDTPLPGCGFYATPHAAASATGWGEGIATVLLSGSATGAVEAGFDVRAAVAGRLDDLGRRVKNPDGSPATAGLIVLDRDGNGAIGYTTPRMARAVWRPGHDAIIVVE